MFIRIGLSVGAVLMSFEIVSVIVFSCLLMVLPLLQNESDGPRTLRYPYRCDEQVTIPRQQRLFGITPLHTNEQKLSQLKNLAGVSPEQDVRCVRKGKSYEKESDVPHDLVDKVQHFVS